MSLLECCVLSYEEVPAGRSFVCSPTNHTDRKCKSLDLRFRRLTSSSWESPSVSFVGARGAASIIHSRFYKVQGRIRSWRAVAVATKTNARAGSLLLRKKLRLDCVDFSNSVREQAAIVGAVCVGRRVRYCCSRIRRDKECSCTITPCISQFVLRDFDIPNHRQ